MSSDEHRREVKAELARRRRMVLQVIVSAVVALVPLSYLLPLWALGLVALVEVGLVAMVIARYRQIVAAVRSQGY